MSSAIGQIALPFNYERLRGKLLSEPAIDALFTFRDLEED